MLRFAFAGLLVVLSLQAQTPSLAVRVQLPDSTLDLVDGGTIPFVAAGIKRSLSANVTVTNRTNQSATINLTTLTGSSDFTVSGLQEGSFVAVQNQPFTFQLTFNPSTSNRLTAQFRLNYTIGTTTSNYTINLAGTAPEFVYSYTGQGANSATLLSGGTIQFPATAIDGSFSTAVILVSNRGTAPGVFSGASVTGAEFQTVGVPQPGTNVDPGRDVRFSVTFTPKLLDPVSGSLTVDTGDNRARFTLTGSGSGAVWAYEVVQAEGARPLTPGQTIVVPDATVGGDKTSVGIRFRNNGNLDARITVISAAGAGFSLSETPLLPLLVPVGQSVTFTVNFLPTAPGRVAGRLRIGTDDFDLVANGLGATLTYAYVINNVSTQVAPGGSVIFTPASVGGSSNLRFTMTNTGTSATTISSIGLSAPSTIFVLGPLPALPLKLDPNASTSLDIQFLPTALGVNTATLRVDNQSFTLSGAGNAPPPLPPMQFDGATGAQEALQQPAIGFTLARAYPLALSGTLTLAFASDVFANDPAVQFATGGRTVAFTIPANSSRAVFANNANQIRVQTGSVAGTITLTPSISTTDGGINLTPTTPPTLNLTVAAGAPRILSVAVGAKTANSITLLVSGYATSRSVTQVDLTFTPTQGENVGTTKATLAVEPAFLGYYQSTAAAPFGSLFTASIPLTLAGDLKNVTQLSDTLQSVSVTLTNRVGTSPATSLALR